MPASRNAHCDSSACPHYEITLLAQAELLHIAARAHDFLAAHGHISDAAQYRPLPDEAGHQVASASPAHADTLVGAHTTYPADLPLSHAPYEF
jgi:hypothetical protein